MPYGSMKDPFNRTYKANNVYKSFKKCHPCSKMKWESIEQKMEQFLEPHL